MGGKERRREDSIVTREVRSETQKTTCFVTNRFPIVGDTNKFLLASSSIFTNLKCFKGVEKQIIEIRVNV